MVPKLVYEILPFIYILIAIGVLATLHTTIGLMSFASIMLLLAGLLLGMTGVAVWPCATATGGIRKRKTEIVRLYQEAMA